MGGVIGGGGSASFGCIFLSSARRSSSHSSLPSPLAIRGRWRPSCWPSVSESPYLAAPRRLSIKALRYWGVFVFVMEEDGVEMTVESFDVVEEPVDDGVTVSV